MVSRGRVVRSWGSMVRLGLRVDRDSLVRYISNVTVVVVGGVLNVLGPAIGKSNRVAASNSTVGIGCLGSVESGLGVVISNTILKSIRSGLLLLISGGGVAISRGGMVDNRSVGNDGGGVHGVGNNRGVIWGRGMVNNRGVIRSSGMVDNRGVIGGRGMVDNRGMVSRGSMVGRGWGITNMVGNSSRSMDSSHWLLITSISMDRLRRSVGLAGNAGMISTMGLVDRVGDGRSIS
jgi:hypothetical protein